MTLPSFGASVFFGGFELSKALIAQFVFVTARAPADEFLALLAGEGLLVRVPAGSIPRDATLHEGILLELRGSEQHIAELALDPGSVGLPLLDGSLRIVHEERFFEAVLVGDALRFTDRGRELGELFVEPGELGAQRFR